MKIIQLILITLLATVSGCKKVTPETGFSYFISPTDEGSVTFTNNTSNGEKFNWDFGDGASSTSKHTTHKYSKNGSYLVNLKATSIDNVSSSASQIVNIENVRGTCVFYVNHNFGEVIDISVNGSYVGTITKYVISGEPACNADGFVTIIAKEGSYGWSARTRSGSLEWDGFINVKSGICNSMRLDP